jgi:hypothetical protein
MLESAFNCGFISVELNSTHGESQNLETVQPASIADYILLSDSYNAKDLSLAICTERRRYRYGRSLIYKLPLPDKTRGNECLAGCLRLVRALRLIICFPRCSKASKTTPFSNHKHIVDEAQLFRSYLELINLRKSERHIGKEPRLTAVGIASTTVPSMLGKSPHVTGNSPSISLRSLTALFMR